VFTVQCIGGNRRLTAFREEAKLEIPWIPHTKRKENMNAIRIQTLPFAVRCLSALFALAWIMGAAAVPSNAQGFPVYNSIPFPLPPDVYSEGPEAYAYTQIGDGVSLAAPHGSKLDQVTVIMSSYACVTGNWYTPGTCVTPPGSTYTIPITLNIYSVVTGTSLEGVTPAPAPGALLATVTKSFAIPYRPSGNSVNCSAATYSLFYDARTQTCNYGFASPITFDFSSLNVTLPSQIILGVQFNTTHYGPNPIGQGAACFSTVAGCFYDSLNVSTDSDRGAFLGVGSVLNVNGIFFDYVNPGNSCNGAATPGVFGLDASPGCWTGYHPEILITAKKF
jgi:hypothetical protein